MRKTFIAFAVLILTASANVMAQKPAEVAVRNKLAAQSAAWNKGNIEAFMKGYWENDSLMFIGKSGITYGYKNTLSNYKKSYPDVGAMGTLTFTIIKIKAISDNYQQVIGKWHLKRIKGNLEGHFTLLFQKFGPKWLIVMDHSS